MIFNLHKSTEKACLYSKNNIIYKVNKEFVDLTGYQEDEILNKSLRELSILLRNDSQTCLEDMSLGEYNSYIFTKGHMPKDVIISWKNQIEEDRVCTIEQNQNSPFVSIISHLYSFDIDRGAIAFYSYPDCILLKANKKYIDTLVSMDIETSDLLGKTPPYPEFLLDTIEKGTPCYETEMEFIKKNGELSYWEISSIPIYVGGEIRYLINNLYDVTERVLFRKLHERQKREQELILENINDQIIHVNNKGEYIYMNKAARDNFDLLFKDKELNNKSIYKTRKFLDIEGNKILFKDTPIQRVLKGEQITNFLFISTDEKTTYYREVSGTPIYDDFGNIEGGVMIYRDVTDKFKLEKHSIFKENIKTNPLHYANLSYPNFKITYINNTGYKSVKSLYSGINTMSSIIGRNFFDFYCLNKDEAIELITGIKKSIEEKSISYVHNQKFIIDGETKYIKTIFQPIFTENKQVEKVIAFGIDITNEKISNEQMASALKVQEEVFINTSHELKTPLNLIFSASQLLELYLKKDNIVDSKDEIASYNKIIMQNCYRLTKLVNNIMDVSKIEAGFYEQNFTNENIVRVVENIVQSVSGYIKEKGLKLIFDTEVEEKVIACDLNKIERIVLNLLSNAIKYSKPDGFILVNILDKGDIVEITVEDNGLGISKKHLNMIFEKFRQVNTALNRGAEGTGIGLSLVRSLVELHGGKISVESTLGEGSIFTVELPNVTINNPTKAQLSSSDNNLVEKIQFELSDIY